VAHAEAEHREEGAMLAALLHEPHELRGARDTDVEVAVRGEDDAIVAALDVCLTSEVVRHADARAPGGGSTCLQLLQRTEDALLLRRRGRGKHDARTSGIHYHRDPVLRPQL